MGTRWVNLCALTLAAAAIVIGTPAAGGDNNEEQREAYLEELLEILPESSEWEEWLEDSGELPPDFDALPAHAMPPSPLLESLEPGAAEINDAADWPAQRERLLERVQEWIIGTYPEAPDNLRAEILEERDEVNATSREIRLHFGPDEEANLYVELFIPDGDGPHPVFLTQANHRAWGLIALRRGYIVGVYAGADAHDDTDTFIDAYPDYDWTLLTRRAWAAGRVMDYLDAEVPQADMDRVAVTGHSRNGKQSLIASAIDERIDAVISSSSGAGGSVSSRLYAEHHFGESIEILTRRFPDWMHPRFRFFCGRENLLPADLHDVMALSAPRPTLVTTAFNDNVESTWAIEQTYRAIRPAWELHGAEDNLRILYRWGGHETWTDTLERYMDWCDHVLGRAVHHFPERLLHAADWLEWAAGEREATEGAVMGLPVIDYPAAANSAGDWADKREQVREAVDAIMGDAPPGAFNPGGTYGQERDYIAGMLARGSAGSGLDRERIVFGEYINGDLYTPEDADEPLPAVLWLHPACHARGYVPAYRRGTHPHQNIARAGFAVFAFDHIGHGRRVEEAEGFYDRHPEWSLLGKMVRDSQAALDVMAEHPAIDSERIYVVGYAQGAFAALHLGVVDERAAGYAIVAPPPTLRDETTASATGGVSRWSHAKMLAPRLGYFVGHEDQTPYDTGHLLAALAPNPALVVTPELDWLAPVEHGLFAVAQAQHVYALQGAEDSLTHQIPHAYNHFDADQQEPVIEWLQNQAGVE